MPNDYSKPFDNRLLVKILGKNNKTDNRIPFSDKFSSVVDSYLMPTETIQEKRGALKTAGWTDSDIDGIIAAQRKYINDAKDNANLLGVPSLINPYAVTRLVGAIDGSVNRLIDSSNRRPWYEVNTNNANDIGYSRYPTTSALIDWGKSDNSGKTPYQFQDFVFCKWWNKIPNNRLITLRRYAMPILDNLSTPGDGANEQLTDIKFPPLATAVTYFGEETGNSLKDILKFSTGMNWGDTSANVWDVTGDNVSTNETMEGIGSKLKANVLFTGLGHALNGLSILDNNINNAGFVEKNGLPPDPYSNGPYENRIKGPVNRIDSVKKRDAGLKFEMSGLKIKFDYVGRPIGGINSKAVLLDILSNFMIMGSASAVFFGGAHRFRVRGVRFPAFNHTAIKKWYNGDLDGGVKEMFNTFTDAITGDYNGNNFLGMIMDVGKGLWADLMNLIGNPMGYKPNGAETESGKTGAAGIKNALTQRMHSGMRVPYLTGMRALLIGEPVGEWHLTIGNPMNPIAMIGNLICTNIEVEFDESAGLGPDDFPLGFTVTVTLDHGMPRDRDAIESMFNRGSGRIYELPKNFMGSADKQTKVDDQTQSVSESPIAKGTEYKETPTSEIGRKLNVPNSKSANVIMSPRNANINNGVYVDFSDDDKIVDRIPTVVSVDWIINKCLK